MHEKDITLQISEKQLATLISGLLFSCSVNVVSNTNSEYQRELFELAKELKQVRPYIKLNDIQFVHEENYEDSLSEEVLREFVEGMEIISFEEA